MEIQKPQEHPRVRSHLRELHSQARVERPGATVKAIRTSYPSARHRLVSGQRRLVFLRVAHRMPPQMGGLKRASGSELGWVKAVKVATTLG